MYEWNHAEAAGKVTFTCGYCGKETAPNKWFRDVHNYAHIYICPACTKPTFCEHTTGLHTPSVRLGRDIMGISSGDIANLYNEARDCTSAGAYTAAALICRKILMNLAVQHGADGNKSFVFYVDYLAEKGFVPPNGRTWVDAIRLKGNEATHEIELMDNKDAQLVLHFTEALLRFNYEMPHLLENHNKS